MKHFARRATIATVLAATALGACRKKQPAATPTPMPTTGPDTAGQGAAAAAARAEAERRRLADSAAAANAARERMMAEARAALTAAVYFEYDAAEITGDARSTLDAKLPLLNANSSLRIRIAGHTDSRGSDEYNLALGQRRASATKAYLTQRGVDASRIDIVSFGEERPAAEGEGEGAWTRNRRAEFEVVSGGETLMLPSR